MLTKAFPVKEKFGIISQLGRAAVSICSNLAEGASRITAKEKKRYFEIARGSLVELDTQLEICQMLEYCNQSTGIQRLVMNIFKILTKLISNQSNSINKI